MPVNRTMELPNPVEARTHQSIVDAAGRGGGGGRLDLLSFLYVVSMDPARPKQLSTVSVRR